MDLMVLYEDGLRKKIKLLEDIKKKKEDLIRETTSVSLRKTAREKVQKEYYTVHKKYNKILTELNRTNKSTKTNTSSSKGSSKTSDSERLHCKAKKYEAKIEKMNDILKIASDSKEKVLEYQMDLQTSMDRLKLHYEQLNIQLKNKQTLTISLAESEKRMHQLKTNLSNLGVLSSIEKSRVHTSSNLIEEDNLKKEFLELQNMRNEILSARPRGMFNPKYQKEKNLSKEVIRKYFENDEAIDCIDYLIELKNNEVFNSDTNLLKYIQANSNETTIFMKCLSNLSIDEVKKLLIHFFIKVVDLKESGRENDEIIAKLDEINDKQRRSIISLNNSYQEFHLSIEKKLVSLRKSYQEKLNLLFSVLDEENNPINTLKMGQEISNLKKRIQELEKSRTTHTVRPKEVLMMPEPHISLDEASKSGSETMSSAKVTYYKNKLKIQKNKSKLT
ncbi:Hypothetical protein CINCED_3A009059 [Cinara cedri]|nr:Hypothetical protein CINCED_3A009059 [Cinara cedri]